VSHTVAGWAIWTRWSLLERPSQNPQTLISSVSQATGTNEGAKRPCPDRCGGGERGPGTGLRVSEPKTCRGLVSSLPPPSLCCIIPLALFLQSGIEVPTVVSVRNCPRNNSTLEPCPRLHFFGLRHIRYFGPMLTSSSRATQPAGSLSNHSPHTTNDTTPQSTHPQQ
jgi:hypothetical protein